MTQVAGIKDLAGQRQLILLMLPCLLASACESTPPPRAHRYLGQIQYVGTAEEVRRGFYYTAKRSERIFGVLPDSMEVPADGGTLKSCAYHGDPAVHFALVRYYYYWTDAGQAIKSYARWALLEDAVPAVRGNLAEVTLRAGDTGTCPVVTVIRATDLEEADCEYRDNKRNGVVEFAATFSKTGGPGTASVYCPFLKSEGWEKMPLGDYSSQLLGGFAWSRLR